MTRVSIRDVRTRLLAVVVVALAIALAAATVGFNVLLDRASNRDANALLRDRVDSERSLLQLNGGKISVSEVSQDRLADNRIWIFSGAGPLEEPEAQAQTAAAARELSVGLSRYATLSESNERLYSLPVLAGGRRLGTIVAGVSLAPYEHTERLALVASTVFACALLLAVGAAVWWLLRSALRPVARMTEQAAAWSDDSTEGRFRLGPPHDELTRLAWTLDQLLDRISASLRHERLLSAELSHELRTPLAKLRAEA
jgi:two-component system, OmpR family, sensor kinase